MQHTIKPLSLALVAAFALLAGGAYAGDRPAAAQSGPLGVTLYSDVGFGGALTTFVNDFKDLSITALNDRASSLRLGINGAVVTLFEDRYFQGRCQAFSVDTADLRGTTIGNDAASSLLLYSSSMCGTPWVMLYEHDHFQGAGYTYRRSYPNLSITRPGNRQASSLIVGSGTTVSLYTEPDYKGTCQTFSGGATPVLLGTLVGNDTIQSLKIGEWCPSSFIPHGIYVNDVTVIAGSWAGIACPGGYEKNTQDLNQGAGGAYIYLCVKYGNTTTISDVFTVSGYSAGIGCARHDATKINVDLNKGVTGSKWIFLCVGHRSSVEKLKKVGFQAYDSWWAFGAYNCPADIYDLDYAENWKDLNETAGGKLIKMCQKREWLGAS